MWCHLRKPQTYPGERVDCAVSLTIEIPLPPKRCSPNGQHGHWSTQAAARKEYRHWAYIAALAVKPKEWDASPVRIDHEWFMGGGRKGDGSYRPLDTGNAVAALKGAIDGLKDAGVIEDDNHLLVKWGECILHRTKKEHNGKSCVVLTLSELK